MPPGSDVKKLAWDPLCSPEKPQMGPKLQVLVEETDAREGNQGVCTSTFQLLPSATWEGNTVFEGFVFCLPEAH